jgi:hypothetical protein
MKPLNPNLEILNNIKIQMTEFSKSYTPNVLNLVFSICLAFRYLYLGFERNGVSL